MLVCVNATSVVSHRFGNAAGRWRSSHAPTWATCSERPHPTRSLGGRDRSSTKTTDAWPKSGWMNLKTFSTSSPLVSLCVFVCVCLHMYASVHIFAHAWSLISAAGQIYPLSCGKRDHAAVTQ